MLGVLEMAGRGSGFLRRREASYLPSHSDVHVGERLIRQFGLRTGDEIAGSVRAAAKGKSASLETITTVLGKSPEVLRERPEFSSLGAVHPNEQLRLEATGKPGGPSDYTNRVIDLLCPMGKGQRALIVAPAKAGKTMVLQSIAQGVSVNYPKADLFILLVDERPEEVFEMEAAGVGEVIASSFDNPAQRHVAVAELTLERARRRVEMGDDVVLIVDSLTRLARAYNAVEKGTGRTLSGGLDAQSLEKPKHFLGTARRIDPSQSGGSLTIIATALVDTGSKMDQVIFEEFKGTGNSELVLSRELAERRIFPAIDLVASATRREELLLSDEALTASRALRQRIAGMTPINAMSDLLTDLKRHPTNDALIRVDTSLFGMEESSMRRPRRTYPPEFRRQLIELVHAGRSPESLAKEFEPAAQTIRNWARQAARDGGQRTDGLTTPERQELTRLRRELRQVKLEREILSKATAWFARETGTIPAASPRSTGS